MKLEFQEKIVQTLNKDSGWEHPTLIKMKTRAGRNRDLVDINHLEMTANVDKPNQERQ